MPLERSQVVSLKFTLLEAVLKTYKEDRKATSGDRRSIPTTVFDAEQPSRGGRDATQDITPRYGASRRRGE